MTVESKRRKSDCRGFGLSAILLIGALIISAQDGLAASLQDFFTNREIVTATSGTIFGNNQLATFEPLEPLHGGKPGGHSLWISWVAPTDGIVTFRTDGSAFDTLLSAYFFGSTNDTTLDKLHEAARNDDFPGIQPASLITFGALAGHSYEIAVDGYYGATGAVQLAWSFISASAPPPIVVTTPNDQAAKLGDPVSLAVNLQLFGSVQIRWRLNEVELDNENSATLSIPSLQATNVGRYDLRIRSGNVTFFTTPTELQINSEGVTNSLAEDKLFDSPGSALEGGDDGHFVPLLARLAGRPLSLGVVRGYSGSQVFDTTYATADPSEPAHCGVAGGASYWLAYQPPTNGTITLDTSGSTFDTVLQAYSTNGPLTGYSSLVSIACDNDSVAPAGAARVSFQVVKSRQYYIVVDGVNGAKGIAWLNYRLDTNALPTAPALTAPATPRVAALGSPVTLAPGIAGSPPMLFSWRKNQTPIPGATNASLFLPAVSPNDTADYSLLVTNDLGTLNVVLPLKVVVPTTCAMARSVSGVRLSWATTAGQKYTVEETASLSGPWVAWSNSVFGDGSTNIVDLPVLDARLYRVRIE